jgi:nucleotide-binding universal stress UspA family protein
MKKILVPVDFSVPSLEAVKFAINIASKSKGEVKLVHIVELPVLYDSTLMPALSFEEVYYDDMRKSSEKQFDKIKAKLKTDNVKLRSSVAFGNFTAKLLGEIATSKADLVVMGTHGASGIREFIIGSNTEKIVRQSPVPVIVIKKAQKAEDIKDIVFAVSSTEEDEDLVQEIKQLQDFFKAQLHLVFINTPALFRRDSKTIPELKLFAKRFMLKNFTLNVFNDLNEEDGLKNFAEMKKAGLIAMATHGRRGLAHLMSGSVTEDVVNHIDCPIWTYKIK